MAKQRHLTVIVVRGTTQHTLNFQFPRFVLPVVATLFLVAVSAAAISIHSWYQTRQGNQALVSDLQTKEQTIGQQQAAIRDLAEKTQQAQPLLQQLEDLHKQLQDLLKANEAKLEDGNTSSEAPASEQTAQAAYGQGGSPGAGEQHQVQTMAAILPPEVRTYVLGRASTRTATVASRSVQSFNRERQSALDMAQATSALLQQQMAEASRLKSALTTDQKEMNSRLDYLAHSPAGAPVSGYTVTSEYGWRWSPFGWGRDFHPGIDLAVEYGTPVYATADGVVTEAGYYTSWYGVAVVIDHGYSLETLYAHLQSGVAVKVGDKVKRGQLLGYVGMTGDTTGPHSHYEVHVDGRTVDPWTYINK